MIRENEIITHEEVTTVTCRLRIPTFEMKEAMGKHFPGIFGLVMGSGGQVIGQPFTLYHAYDPENVDIELGVPVAGPFDLDNEEYRFSTLPAGRVARAQYYGPYGKLGDGYDELGKWIKQQDEKNRFPNWEIYVSDPMETEDLNELRTDIHMLLE